MTTNNNIRQQQHYFDQNILKQTEVYRLGSDGQATAFEHQIILKSHEIYLQQRGDYQSFPCTHQFLNEHWVESDYTFVLTRGCCQYTLQEDELILTQRGVLRFGCPLGLSLEGLIETLSYNITSPISISIKCQPDQPGEEPILHRVDYSLTLLSKISQLALQHKIIQDKELSEIPLEQIKEINRLMAKSKQQLERAELQLSKPYSCKDCKAYKNINADTLTLLNAMREKAVAIFACGGCLRLIENSGGCSMTPCKYYPTADIGCLSNTKTCVFCVDGATGLVHKSIAECTTQLDRCRKEGLPFPLLKACECETSATNL